MTVEQAEPSLGTIEKQLMAQIVRGIDALDPAQAEQYQNLAGGIRQLVGALESVRSEKGRDA